MRISASILRGANTRPTVQRAVIISRARTIFWQTAKRREAIERRKKVRDMEAAHKAMRTEQPDYTKWSQEDLLKRVMELEGSLAMFNKTSIADPTPRAIKKAKKEKSFDPSKYNTRFIALKLAYLGKKYNGFEHHVGNVTPLPTVEEKIWEALIKARLIFPKPISGQEAEVNWEGCEYSKCGRTDRGVSAFGQVIGLRVRSNRPMPKKKLSHEQQQLQREKLEEEPMAPREGGIEINTPALRQANRETTGQNPSEIDINDPELEEALNWDPISDELPYAALLNRLLPPDIRILAWCPAPPVDFSARFSCRERQYKYFFTNPCFLPPPEDPSKPNPQHQITNGVREGWLDIAAIKEAASYFVGEHDFRNFCKIDGSKQIENFCRRMFVADIIPVDNTTGALSILNASEFGRGGVEGKAPQVYSFTLHGSAFLWHQVRCMVSVLFLVGQGLEKPTIVRDLLDVSKNPTRPAYEMASDTPLVLWDCIFPSDTRECAESREDAIEWLYIGDEPHNGEKKWGSCGVAEDVWKVWHEAKIDEVLRAELLGIVSKQGKPLSELTTDTWRKRVNSQKVFQGGDKAKLTGTYTPISKKPRMEGAEAINEKYAVRKGYAGAKDMKEKQQAAREARNTAANKMDIDADE